MFAKVPIQGVPSTKGIGCMVIISILPKNHAGPVEMLISDFFRMPKKLAQYIPYNIKVT